MREGNQFIRIPVSAAKPGTVAMVITGLASGPRKAYAAKRVRYSLNGNDELVTTVSGKLVALYNTLESTTGTLFLIVGDEVETWSQSGKQVCMAIPRGFLRT